MLHSASLSVKSGAITALVGANGCGKSTLMRCMVGALRPWSGQVLLNETALHRHSARQIARQITYVPQETPMPFAFTVTEFLALAPGVSGEGEEAGRLEAAMIAMNLGSVASRAVDTLSGGERQRIAISRALAQEAPLLLLDEPTAHLDLRYQIALFQALREKAETKKAAILVVLHDLVLAARWADQIALMDHGQVVAVGSPDTVLTEENLREVYQVPLGILKQGEKILAIYPRDDLMPS
ncbi:MAG: ABC transporter ATP-binding protein [Cytophagales bacterium]|nr:ABC transporter ATP-binding protein [Armatimonadota bacterium]